jgi:hypothetical protein
LSVCIKGLAKHIEDTEILVTERPKC